MTDMDFGGAIKALKEGKKVARASWSGDQISFLYLVQGSTFTVNRAPLAPLFGGKVVNYQGHIDAFWNAPAYASGGSRLHAWGVAAHPGRHARPRLARPRLAQPILTTR
ncbi:MAG: DUF2829 domain-containing protein [Devosia sp.]|nr:MW1434 family type I TA system toxin [Devosia sp.]MBN9308351.1 DUF2829 domain-containing protein [Devosia sp.]MBN9314261.1 DUF2829 domain-containing protein [Devosia sp.]